MKPGARQFAICASWGLIGMRYLYDGQLSGMLKCGDRLGGTGRWESRSVVLLRAGFEYAKLPI
jgi:hypothetical protein